MILGKMFSDFPDSANDRIEFKFGYPFDLVAFRATTGNFFGHFVVETAK